MRSDDHLRLVRRYFDEIWNLRQREVIAEIFADEFIMHTGQRDHTWTPKDIDSAVERWCGAFPDMHYDILHIGTADDDVFVNSVYAGTHSWVFEWGGHGPWEPTNRRFVSPEMFVFRIAQNRITECWPIWDAYDVATQLGIQLS
jgi:predicted ester cyclase